MALVDTKESFQPLIQLPRRLRRDKVWRVWLVAWFGAMAIGISNATLRELTMQALSDRAAHQLSTATLLAFLSLYMWWLQQRHPIASSRMAWRIGAVWSAATVAFEFALGLGVTGDSLSYLVGNYNILAGRLWLFVPLWMFLGPVTFRRVLKEMQR